MTTQRQLSEKEKEEQKALISGLVGGISDNRSDKASLRMMVSVSIVHGLNGVEPDLIRTLGQDDYDKICGMFDPPSAFTKGGELFNHMYNAIKAGIESGVITSQEEGQVYVDAYQTIANYYLQEIKKNPSDAMEYLSKMEREIKQVEVTRETLLELQILRDANSKITGPIKGWLESMGDNCSNGVRERLAPDGAVMQSIRSSIQAGVQSGTITSLQEGQAYVDIYRQIILDNLKKIEEKPRSIFLPALMQIEVEKMGKAFMQAQQAKKQQDVKPDVKPHSGKSVKEKISKFFTLRRHAGDVSSSQNKSKEDRASSSAEAESKSTSESRASFRK